jgi:hypothetical protein
MPPDCYISAPIESLKEEAFMPGPESESLVRLATAPNPALAHVWEQALRDEGIKCKVVGDYLDAGHIPGLTAEIWVHEHDLAAAQEVLKRNPSTRSPLSPKEGTDEEEAGGA